MTGRAALLTFALLGLSLTGAIAHAADPDPCQDAVTTLQITTCAIRNQDAAERELNVTYARIRATLAKDPSCKTCLQARTALTAAQRTWVDFRKRDCDALYRLYADGTIAPATLSGCMADHATTRTRQLQSHFESGR